MGRARFYPLPVRHVVRELDEAERREGDCAPDEQKARRSAAGGTLAEAAREREGGRL